MMRTTRTTTVLPRHHKAGFPMPGHVRIRGRHSTERAPNQKYSAWSLRASTHRAVVVEYPRPSMQKKEKRDIDPCGNRSTICFQWMIPIRGRDDRDWAGRLDRGHLYRGIPRLRAGYSTLPHAAQPGRPVEPLRG